MEIVQLIDSLNWGGAQKLLATFAECAQRRSLGLTIISLRDTAESPLTETLRSYGARVTAFSAHSLADMTRIWKVSSFLQNNQTSVIQSHLTYANIIGAMAGMLAGVPQVGTLHNARMNSRLPLRKQLEMWALRYRTQQVVAVGFKSAEIYQHHLGNKHIDVIPNCVSLAKQLSIAERLSIREALLGDPQRPLLISVGRLIGLKGYSDLITAFAALHKIHANAALVIAGDGELYDQLNNQIETLGLQGHACLLGRRDDVPQLLSAADLYVSASHTEGLPIALLEAMAAGLPAVATAVGDVPYVLTTDTGIMVSPKQPQILAEALQSMLDNPSRMQAFGQAAKLRVETCYNPDIWFDRLMHVYRNAMKPSLYVRQETT